MGEKSVTAQKPGTFYAVGVGPGDPELMTLKAVRILERCPVIAAPETENGRMLALDIASQAADLTGKTVLPLRFPMTRDPEKLRQAHAEAAEAIAAHLRSGVDVAMVNLGDVSVYATVCYVLALLEEQGLPAVMVPGVTSFCAVAARLGMSLTEMNEPLHIIPASGTDLEAALRLPGSKVLMKSGSAVHRTVEILDRLGLLEQSAMVADCGLPDEQVYRDLHALPEKVSYFATFLVRA